VVVSYALLGLLEESSRHGYDLKRSYDRRFGEVKPIRFGQVYRTLSQLERDGLVEVVQVEAGAGPERKRYSITREGVIDLDTWLGEPEEPRPLLRSVLFTKVVVALLSGRSAARFLDLQRAVHVETMHALLADYQLFHLEADLRWIDHAESRLASLAEEVRDDADPRG
jgi:DNA-binding PadR family transcriptional regulator